VVGDVEMKTTKRKRENTMTTMTVMMIMLRFTQELSALLCVTKRLFFARGRYRREILLNHRIGARLQLPSTLQ